MGLDVYVNEVGKKSEKYPDHLFEVGYFRSSYNSGGFNRIVSDAIQADLYTILDPYESDDGYHIDWAVALVRVKEAIEKFKEFMDSDAAKYKVMPIRPRMYAPSFEVEHDINSPFTAKAAFLAEMQKIMGKGDDTPFKSNGWSNYYGDFFPTPLKVVAILEGKDDVWPDKNCFYAVYEVDEDMWTWYLQALEIVEETCIYCLSQPDPDEITVIWSA